VEIGGMYLLSQLEDTPSTWCTWFSKRGWAWTPPSLPGWANFSIMMECTLESGRCHFVYSVGYSHQTLFFVFFSTFL
jgi:hypothetical protein